ncbi:hypothetical protein E4U19_004835 [Claviceps sp. Clav32 group G5]|nr:hypothetical protein E4U40_004924 [Claviceps sp. LM458 group G5]KAG6022675.1 hypothetical protein E4U19_004835 [Claviceps sp. Clav32 group G5]
MPIHLLDLPVDVLALILKPFLVQRRTIPLCPCGSSFHSWSRLEVRPLPILLVNSVIHRIATRLFYQSNTFMLDLEHDHGPHVEGCLPELAKGAHAADVLRVQNGPDAGAPTYRGKNILMIWPALSRIRCLEIRLEQLEPWVGRLVWPLIQDMIVRGDLTDLRVKVNACTDFISDSEDNSNPLDPSESLRDHFVTWELGPSQENGLKKWPPMSTKGEVAAKARNIIFTVSPLASLLATVQNPHLRTSRLWVSVKTLHWPAWEPYHKPRRVGANIPENSPSHIDSEMMEIDWKSILSVIDPEGRAKAAGSAE